MDTKRKFAASLLCAAAMSISLSGCSNITFNPSQLQDQPVYSAAQVQYYFLVYAHDGFVSKGVDGATYLTLHSPKILAVSERPHRIQTPLSAEKFVGFWKNKLSDNFLIDPPNTTITGVYYDGDATIANEHEVNKLIELSNASVDSNGNLVFKIKDFGPDETLNVHRHFKYTTLVVDGLIVNGNAF